MKLPKDSREFVELLLSNKVDFLVVGAYAVAFHGHPRLTGDFDVFVSITSENVKRLVKSLAEFGFGNVGITELDFEKRETIIQLGYEPNRIDLLTSISGVEFDEAWAHRTPGDLDGIAVNFISRELLLKNKTTAGRDKDLADISALNKRSEKQGG